MAQPSLLEVLEAVPDPRSRHGRFHPLSAILSLTVLAMLHGCKGPTAISQFGRDHGVALAHLLGFRRGKTPAPSCLSDLYRALDAVAFEAALSRWLASRLPPGEEKQPVSLDGKNLRGSQDGSAPGQHLVAAYAHEQQAVLAQIRVDAKTNEHKAALELLGILPVQGRVILGDAMFCQRDLCEKIIEKGGDYLFTVKGNQLGLERDIEAGFSYEASARQTAEAFSPSADPGIAGTRVFPRRKTTRSNRKANRADDLHPDAGPKMARLGTRAEDHAGANRERQNHRGNRIRDDQPQADRGQCETSSGVGA